jgi:hypothetical protein
VFFATKVMCEICSVDVLLGGEHGEVREISGS